MPKRMEPPPAPKKRVVFRPWRVDPRTGRKLWAKNYGFKAWPMEVDDE